MRSAVWHVLAQTVGSFAGIINFQTPTAVVQGAETDKAVERDPANRPEPPQQRGTAGAGLLTRQLSSSVSNDSSRESSMGLGSAPQPQFTHFLCVSPDAPTNPVLYWVGNFDAKNTRFLLEGAHGPTKLDLGDVLYAPNLMKDAKVQSKAAWCAAQDGIQAAMHQGWGSNVYAFNLRHCAQVLDRQPLVPLTEPWHQA